MSDNKEVTPEEIDALRNAQPTWMKDGGGVKGVPIVVENTKGLINFQSKVVFRRADLNAPAS